MSKKWYLPVSVVVLIATLLTGCGSRDRDVAGETLAAGREPPPLASRTLTPIVAPGTNGESVAGVDLSPIDTPLPPTDLPPSDTPLPPEPLSPIDTPVLLTDTPIPPTDTPAPTKSATPAVMTDTPEPAAPTNTWTPAVKTDTPTPTPTHTPTASPYPCPRATQEYLWVEPVTSPTDQLSQKVVVHMGNMEAVTITTESGVFTSAGPVVEVALLPNTVHHLEVVAKVKLVIGYGDCLYGGYTMHTLRDKNGAMLVIEQGQPAPPPVPSSVIGPCNVSQLQSLFALAPDARLTTDFAFESNSILVSVGYDSEIVRWSLVTGQERGRIGDGLEEAEAGCLAMNADRSRLATCGTFDQWGIYLWDMATGEMSEIGEPGTGASVLAFSPSGSLLTSGSNDNEVWIWDVASRQALTSFAGDVPQRNQMFHGFYWLSDQVVIAAGSDAIYWWDVSTGEQVERLARPEQAASFVNSSFSQHGDRLAAAAQDENVYVWNRGASAWSIWPASPGLRFGHVAFSPDGRLLAAATYSGKLSLWNVETQELAATLDIGGGSAAVRFSPDGRYMASGGRDRPIWLWGIP